ncbi:MAG: hypothetical protein FLDDKLPJ_01758 [Phycisphaerae bacterium]|nr:hypothetical protein [Phycisphaerae bacterium]
MCTVTLIPLDEPASGGERDDARRDVSLAPAFVGDRTSPEGRSGFTAGARLVCNRDESRSRPLALPPQIRRCGDRRAIMPVDPVSDGTWAAVNDAGIAATLLNVYPHPRGAGDPFTGRSSRGLILPRILSATDMASVLRQTGMLNPADYPPFRLVITDARDVVELLSDGTTARIVARSIGGRPHFFTSSGLGDDVVDGPRRELFHERFAPGRDWPAAQSAFHRHAWPDRRNVSVCMERSDACTVSCTVMDIRDDHVSLTYTPGAPDRTKPLAAMRLDVSREAS